MSVIMTRDGLRLLLFFHCILLSVSLDQNGYIVYCPCMGRFGNQAEQLLGTLQFGKAINRTIVLPPFIHYVDREVQFIPFTDYIDIEPIREFHSVITLNEFLKSVAPIRWKEGQRRIFCYSGRSGVRGEDCNPMDGNPYSPFWRQAVGISDFKESIFYSPLTTTKLYANEWMQRYKKYPVIAFVGSPSSFPTNPEAIQLQKHIKFSETAKRKAADYMASRNFPPGPYVGVHLRHGTDWRNACNLLIEHPMSQLFSSHQCHKSQSHLPHDLCLHSEEQIVHDLLTVWHETNISTIYVATDDDDHELWKRLHHKLSAEIPDLTLMTPILTYSSWHPKGKITGRYPAIIEDLVILSQAEHFIGNCISSFSAFVSRTRQWPHKSTSFFARDRAPIPRQEHEEL